MATSFLTQLVELSYDAGLIETAYAQNVSVPVFGPSYSVYKFTPIANPAYKGKARNDHNRFGAAWAEFPFYVELCGFDSFTPQTGGALGGVDVCTNAAPSATVLLCATATYITDGVGVGDKVTNTTTSNTATVVTVDSETQLTTTTITGNYTATDTTTVTQMFKYNPVYWGKLCTAMGMKRTGDGTVDNAAWSYEVVDAIHLNDDTVHTGEYTEPLLALISIDGYYYAIDNAVGSGTFSMDVEAGPPRLTMDTFMGNIYEDDSNVFYWYPHTDIPDDIDTPVEYAPPTPVDAAAAVLSLNVVPNDGTYTPVAVTGVCLKSWTHNIGNTVIAQPCMEAEYKRGQFLIANQNGNTATLTVKVDDPGTQAAPSAFNPYLMVERGDMLDFSLVHNTGSTLNAITFIADYYISDVVDVHDDGNGVLEYTLTLQQANFVPAGTAAQYLKVSLA